MSDANAHPGLYLVHISLHGLIRGHNLELGRDADNGGQVKYVVELARALATHPKLWRLDLLTRLVVDPKIDKDYAQPHEQIAERAHIIRIPFGPRRYIRKEVMWPWLDCFVDLALQHVRNVGRVPDAVHAHYADAGLVGGKLAALLGVPFVYTGHSLGYEKRRRLLENGMKPELVESRYNINQRIEAEELALSGAALVIASTSQEAQQQYSQYQNYRKARGVVIPPGVDIDRFHPPTRERSNPPIKGQIDRFLDAPRKPWILALSRPDERKNIHTLLEAYGENKQLQALANLIIIAGFRDDIRDLDKGSREVLNNMLLEIDRYDLYGKVAYPKEHAPEDVPELYRLAARSGGVFVNPALTEPFGLTLIEAAASGLPMVATHDGGPREILERCKNGVLIDPLDADRMGEALLDALSDRGRWRRWASSGLRGAHRFYTWSGHAQQYVRAIERITSRPPGQRVSHAKTRLPTVDRMVICDIDNTLLGDSQGLEMLLETIRENGKTTAFGIATGRRLHSAVGVLSDTGVDVPDVLITAVGSEINYGPRLNDDSGWRRHIDYRWERQAIRRALADVPGLRLQPRSEQRDHKVSYFIDRDKAPSARQIQRLLRTRDVQVNPVYSHGEFLDLLPIRASKGLAVRYVAHKWGIPMERVLVAGDSGNDEAMLTGRSLGVVVGNFSEELNRLKGRERVYFARAHYARGIVEGIDHYEFFGDIRQPPQVRGSDV